MYCVAMSWNCVLQNLVILVDENDKGNHQAIPKHYISDKKVINLTT